MTVKQLIDFLLKEDPQKIIVYPGNTIPYKNYDHPVHVQIFNDGRISFHYRDWEPADGIENKIDAICL